MVKNSQKQSKDSQNSKHDHWCTNCHILPRLYQQCTNRQKQPKVSQNRKHDRPLVYQFSQVYQDSTNRLPTMYQKNSQKTVKTAKKHWCTNRHTVCLHRVRRIHKATGSTVIGSMTPRNENGSVFYRLHVVDRRLKCTHVVVRLRST